MGTKIQIVIDAVDPLAQARFWAGAMGYEVEDTTELINRVLEAGVATRDAVHEDDGRLYWNDLVGVRDPDASGPRLLFQRNAVTKSQKNPGPPRPERRCRPTVDGGRAPHRPRCRIPLRDRRARRPLRHHGRPRRQRVLRPDHPVAAVWHLLTAPEGLVIWLGDDVTIAREPGEPYETRAGTAGEIRSFHREDRIRLTWQPQDWDHETTVQLVLRAAGDRTRLTLHQERLAGADERERQRSHWKRVADQLAEALAERKPLLRSPGQVGRNPR